MKSQILFNLPPLLPCLSLAIARPSNLQLQPSGTFSQALLVPTPHAGSDSVNPDPFSARSPHLPSHLNLYQRQHDHDGTKDVAQPSLSNNLHHGASSVPVDLSSSLSSANLFSSSISPSPATAATLILDPLPFNEANHHHHASHHPQTVLNETDILLTHSPNPISFWSHDYVLSPEDERLLILSASGGDRHQWGGWIVVGHGFFGTLALVFGLPAVVLLRHTSPRLYPLLLFLVLVLAVASLLSSIVYKSHTPDLYRHSIHGTLGWIVSVLLSMLSLWDAVRVSSPISLPRGIQSGWQFRLRRWWTRTMRERKRGCFGTALSEGEGYDLLQTSRKEDEEGEIEEDDGCNGAGDLHRLEELTLQSRSALYPIQENQDENGSGARLFLDTRRKLVSLSDLSPASSSSTLNPDDPSARHGFAARAQLPASRPLPPSHPYPSVGGSSSFHPSTSDNSQSFSSLIVTIVWWILTVFAYAASLSGLTVYAGACRAEYLNGCLAHLIKGSLFLIYGLITFARYLGAFYSIGWAWNAHPRDLSPKASLPSRWASEVNNRTSAPSPAAPSSSPLPVASSPFSRQIEHQNGVETLPSCRWNARAELVESAVMTIYGGSNTFMERFGAAKGSSFSVHEVEHISIALMWFTLGLLGVILELYSSSSRQDPQEFIHSDDDEEDDGDDLHYEQEQLRHERQTDPRSASLVPGFNPNPFPAAVIGFTGLAMSSHHQNYLFSTQIHALWGSFLMLFALCRILTYVILSTQPPISTLPSRPPTEALASFFVTGGGVAFMLSNEQVVFGAMRGGWDAIMTFLTVTCSIVGLLFVWIVGLVLIGRGGSRRGGRSYSC